MKIEALENITFQPLDFEIGENEITSFYSEVKRINDSSWYFSDYRNCYALPLYTGGGFSKEENMGLHSLRFDWTKEAREKLPQLISFCEESLLSWMNPKPRIVLLKSNPYSEISPHIDCFQEVFHTLQHKIRIVLNGPINSLYFLDEQEKRHFINTEISSYVIDGSHRHGMKNDSSSEKITLCFGSPWNGENSKKYRELIEKSNEKFLGQRITRDIASRPFKESYFKK